MAYYLVMYRYLHYWNKLKVWETPKDFVPTSTITVVIPVRNESQNIEACVHSILSQDFPKNLLELIVVDDYSTDNTVELLQAVNDDRLKVLRLADASAVEIQVAYKKKALEYGIQEANGGLILTTDGDCIVPDRWLQRMAHIFEVKEAKFIAAPVNFHEEKTLLEYFQSLDFTGMMGITGAGIEGRFMNMCNGANLGFTKEVFNQVGGYQGIDHLASGDDMLLMQKIAQKYPEDIHYLKNAAATVITPAQPTLQSFFHQRIRWASKSSDYKEWQVTAMLGVVWLYCWSIFFALGFFFILGSVALGLALILLTAKSAIDYLLLRNTTSFFNRQDLMRYFIPAQLMHILYIVVVGTSALFVKEYKWKGRVVR